MSPQIQTLEATRIHNETQKVFVYGTLKKGFGNHERYLKNCKELGPATVEGIMFHLGGFPAINLNEPFTKLHGEVYEVTWDEIIRMDQLEGVGRGFYDRIQAKVNPHGLVWMYIFPHERAVQEKWMVPGGVWTGHDTYKVLWRGFGKGVNLGSFSTESNGKLIRIGDGTSVYSIIKNVKDNTFELVNHETGEILGKYSELREMKSEEHRRPVLSITHQKKDSVVSADETTTTSIPEKKESIPQAASFLGLKYSEA